MVNLIPRTFGGWSNKMISGKHSPLERNIAQEVQLGFTPVLKS